MIKIAKLSIPITEDIEGFPVPILSFAIAMCLWMSKKPKKEIEKRFKLNKSQNHNFDINYRKRSLDIFLT